ncbi:MAG: AraC family transcriptional regulator [Myxococcota bacterium]
MSGDDWRWFYDGLGRAYQRRADPDRRARLERARSLVHEHYAEELVVADLARCAAMSPFHFVREFRRAFHLTPRQYLIARRIERAKHLLQTTSRSVTEVCLDVGFTSLGSFSTRFARDTGLSPRAYRRVLVPSPESRSPFR